MQQEQSNAAIANSTAITSASTGAMESLSAFVPDRDLFDISAWTNSEAHQLFLSSAMSSDLSLNKQGKLFIPSCEWKNVDIPVKFEASLKAENVSASAGDHLNPANFSKAFLEPFNSLSVPVQNASNTGNSDLTGNCAFEQASQNLPPPTFLDNELEEWLQLPTDESPESNPVVLSSDIWNEGEADDNNKKVKDNDGESNDSTLPKDVAAVSSPCGINVRKVSACFTADVNPNPSDAVERLAPVRNEGGNTVSNGGSFAKENSYADVCKPASSRASHAASINHQQPSSGLRAFAGSDAVLRLTTGRRDSSSNISAGWKSLPAKNCTVPTVSHDSEVPRSATGSSVLTSLAAVKPEGNASCGTLNFSHFSLPAKLYGRQGLKPPAGSGAPSYPASQTQPAESTPSPATLPPPPRVSSLALPPMSPLSQRSRLGGARLQNLVPPTYSLKEGVHVNASSAEKSFQSDSPRFTASPSSEPHPATHGSTRLEADLAEMERQERKKQVEMGCREASAGLERTSPYGPSTARRAAAPTNSGASAGQPRLPLPPKRSGSPDGAADRSAVSMFHPLASPEQGRKREREDDATECTFQSEEFPTGSSEGRRARNNFQQLSADAKRQRAAEVHNQSERRRRDRINDRMKTLQELIPNASKTDKASMLDEAIDYLKMLQSQLQVMSKRTGMSIPPSLAPPSLSNMCQTVKNEVTDILDGGNSVLSDSPFLPAYEPFGSEARAPYRSSLSALSSPLPDLPSNAHSPFSLPPFYAPASLQGSHPLPHNESLLSGDYFAPLAERERLLNARAGIGRPFLPSTSLDRPAISLPPKFNAVRREESVGYDSARRDMSEMLSPASEIAAPSLEALLKNQEAAEWARSDALARAAGSACGQYGLLDGSMTGIVSPTGFQGSEFGAAHIGSGQADIALRNRLDSPVASDEYSQRERALKLLKASYGRSSRGEFGSFVNSGERISHDDLLRNLILRKERGEDPLSSLPSSSERETNNSAASKVLKMMAMCGGGRSASRADNGSFRPTQSPSVSGDHYSAMSHSAALSSFRKDLLDEYAALSNGNPPSQASGGVPAGSEFSAAKMGRGDYHSSHSLSHDGYGRPSVSAAKHMNAPSSFSASAALRMGGVSSAMPAVLPSLKSSSPPAAGLGSNNRARAMESPPSLQQQEQYDQKAMVFAMYERAVQQRKQQMQNFADDRNQY